MVFVPAPPVVLRLPLANTLTLNPPDRVALVPLACSALLPVVGHIILSIGPAPEVALVLSKKYLNLIAEEITFTSLRRTAVDTLQPVPEIQ